MNKNTVIYNFYTTKNADIIGTYLSLAGAEGIEPSSKVLETSVLPLNQAPS